MALTSSRVTLHTSYFAELAAPSEEAIINDSSKGRFLCHP